MRSALPLRATLLAAVLLLSSLCGSCDDTTPAPAPSSTTCDLPGCPCQADDACGDGLRCDAAQQRCIAPACAEDRDCPLSQRCDAGVCRTDVNADFDRDGVPDAVDTCLFTANTDQSDLDRDGLGDACDPDDDNDGIPDALDTCPLTANTDQRDYDQDGLGNACDPDWQGVLLTGQLTSPLGVLPWDTLAVASILGPTGRLPLTVARDGSFTTRLPGAGLHALEVQATGHLPATRTFSIDASDLSLGALALSPEQTSQEQAVPLRGTARLQGQTDHFGTLVQARLGGVLIASTLTDSEGAFVLSLGRADVELRFSHTHYAPRDLQAAWNPALLRFELDGTPSAEWTGVELVPDRSATLTGQLTSSVPVRDWPATAEVTLSGRGSSRAALVTATGTFQLDQLQPGTYTLGVQARGHRPYIAQLNLLSGDNPQGDLRLLPEVQTLITHIGLEGRCDAYDVTLEARSDNGLRVEVRAERPPEGEDTENNTEIEPNGECITSQIIHNNKNNKITIALQPEAHTLSVSHPDYLTEHHDIIWTGEGFALANPPYSLLTAEYLLTTLQPNEDPDRDGVLDAADNCPRDVNPNQEDLDGDGDGDACDDDLDGDGISNAADNCPEAYNPMQERSSDGVTGVTCNGGTLESPALIQRNLLRQVVSTRNRPDATRAFCGGIGAGEVVYTLTTTRGERLEVFVQASHATATYLLDLEGNVAPSLPDTTGQVDPAPSSCTNSERLNWIAPATSRYLLVVDGANEGSEGRMEVTVQRSRPWPYNPDIQRRRGPENLDDFTIAPLEQNDKLDVAFISSSYPRLSINTAYASLSPPACCEEACAGSSPLCARALTHIPVSATPINIEAGDFYTQGAERSIPDLAIVTAPDLKATELSFASLPRATVWTARTQRGNPGVTFQPRLAATLWELAFADIATYVFGGPWDPVEALIPFDSTSADLNEDGHDDLIVVMDRVVLLSAPPAQDFDREPGQVAVLLGDGQGGFGEPQRLATGIFPTNIWLGYYDADDLLDLIVTNTLSSSITLYTGAVGGRFHPPGTGASSPKTIVIGYAPFAVAVGDPNGDGWPDILTLDAVSGDLITLFGGPEGASRLSTLSLGGTLRSMTLGDLDNDGIADLIVGRETENDLLISLNRGWRFPERQTLNLPNTYGPRRLGTADLNGDNNLDIISLSALENELLLIHNDAPVAWSLERSLALGEEVGSSDLSAVVQLDLNGDDTLDLAVLDRATSRDSSMGAIHVFLSDGPLSYAPPTSIPVPTEGLTLHAVDLNHDGLPDLASTHVSSGSIAFVLNSPQGLADAALVVPNWQGYPADLIEIDLDRDGTLDLLSAALQNEPNLRWVKGGPGAMPRGCRGQEDRNPTCHLASGDSTCGFCAWGGEGNGFLQAAAADWDGDGHDELILAQPRAHRVWFVDPDAPGYDNPGTYTSIHPSAVDASGTTSRCLSPAFIASADFDRDGNVDFVVTCRDSSNVFFCENTGEAGAYFTDDGCQIVAGVTNVFDLQAADVNDDGWLDLVATQIQPQAIAILRNSPDPARSGKRAFIPEQGVAARPLLGGLVVDDLDQDGSLDFVAVHRGDAALGLYTAQPTERLLTTEPGTHLVASNLPPCPTLELEGEVLPSGAVRFTAGELACRVIRLEITTSLEDDAAADGYDVTLTSAATRLNFGPLRIITPEQPLPSDRWRPQELPNLARFEDAPARGFWELRGAPLEAATLIINP